MNRRIEGTPRKGVPIIVTKSRANVTKEGQNIASDEANSTPYDHAQIKELVRQTIEAKCGKTYTCRACGSVLPEAPIRIDGRIIYSGARRIKVSQSEAKIAQLLIDALGEPVTIGQMAVALWGATEGPQWEYAIVRSTIMRLRARLQPLGWRIVLAGQGEGYILGRIG